MAASVGQTHCVSVGGALLVVPFCAESKPYPLVLRGMLQSSDTYTTHSRSVGRSVFESSAPAEDVSVSVVSTTACQRRGAVHDDSAVCQLSYVTVSVCSTYLQVWGRLCA